MAVYNADELVAPTWLDETFFQQVLDKNSPAANYKIFELNIAPASQKGDHYASIMFRAKVVYGNSESSKLTSSMIVKTLPTADTEKGAVLSDAQIFQTELKMYETLIPRFEREWQRCGEEIKFAGKILYHSLTTPQPVIVLEDLCTIGYDVLRERLFSLDEVKLALQKLARWHAVSFKLTHQQQPADSDIMQLRHGLFKSASLMRSDYLSNGMKVLIAALEETGGFEEYLPKLRALEPKVIQRCVDMNDAYARDVRGPIYVLTHGDFHGRNLMVKRNAEDDSFKELFFIDFQMCYYGPSCHDLIYTSFVLFSKEIRDNHLMELFDYYFEQFTLSLEKLGVPKPWPSLSDFHEDIKRWNCLEVFMAATYLPLVMLAVPPAEGEEPINFAEFDMDKIFSSSEYRKQFYMRKNFLKAIKELLPVYMKAGYLD